MTDGQARAAVGTRHPELAGDGARSWAGNSGSEDHSRRSGTSEPPDTSHRSREKAVGVRLAPFTSNRIVGQQCPVEALPGTGRGPREFAPRAALVAPVFKTPACSAARHGQRTLERAASFGDPTRDPPTSSHEGRRPTSVLRDERGRAISLESERPSRLVPRPRACLSSALRSSPATTDPRNAEWAARRFAAGCLWA